jgi:hypothetical protein
VLNGWLPPFLASVSSGTRDSLTFPHFQPTFPALCQTISSLIHLLRHFAIRSPIFRDLSRHFRSLPRFPPVFVLLLQPSHLPDFINLFLGRLRTLPVHSSVFFDISRAPPAFLNRFSTGSVALRSQFTF